MKLTKEEAGSFYRILNTANIGGIESLVFQNKDIGVASGMREGSCAIIARIGVPPLPQKMGITRIPTLKKRLDLLIDHNEFAITPKESERGEIVQLDMQAGKTKTQYRCTAAVAIKAPAQIGEGTFIGILTVNKSELAMILNGIRAMGADQIILVIKQDGTVFLESSDANDKFTIELENKIERTEDSDSAVFYYKTDIFDKLLRAAIGTEDSLSIAVEETGILQFGLNDCEMSIFAQIDGANT